MINDLDNRIIWFKGELIRAKEARLYALAPTAQFGLNVFEGIPVYHNEKTGTSYAFRLEDHYRRLSESARMLEIENPYSFDEMKNAFFEAVKANGCDEDLSVRQTLFVDGVGSWASSEPVGMFVSPLPRKRVSKEYQKKTLKCCFSSWRRINEQSISPRIKCGANYINSRMGQREALRNGYDTCIFLNDQGKIAEGPGSCFFMIKDNVLITPQITDSILKSITRDTVIRIAKEEGYSVEERSIDRTETYTCDEAFLCGSTMEITAISSIDGYIISSSEITDRLFSRYIKIAKGENGSYSGWITAIV